MTYSIRILMVGCLLALHPLVARPHRADYVVVGVGTAGATVAKKLSDDKKTSVIALHSGKNLTSDPWISFAANATTTVPFAIVGPPLYENGMTTPQPNADDRTLEWAIAKPLGGATSINAGVWGRGTDQYYREWEKIAGPKWGPKRALKIYKQLEHYHGQTKDPWARGYHGPLSILQDRHPSKVSRVFTKAMIQSTGFPFVLDYNDPKTPIGVSSQLQYTHSGQDGIYRVTSATAFLNDSVMTPSGYGVHGRKLRVLFRSKALKTIWKGKKAIGVKYKHGGKEYKVYANKAVIVCAGLRSSTFLMHSGIGDKKLLKSLNIPVVFDNPNVGKHLSDQPAVRLVFTSSVNDFGANPNGLFSQIAWLPAPHGDKKIRKVRLATITQLPAITLLTLDLCQPKSRGFITINSPNPAAPPVINLGVLSNNSDLELFQKSLQIYIKNLNTTLQKSNPGYQLVFPDPAILDDPALVTAFIRANVSSNEHFQGHCKMAPLHKGGVVNSKGHVYGADKGSLIVGDNSVVPKPMDGSPMATGYFAGANIAEMLIEDK